MRSLIRRALWPVALATLAIGAVACGSDDDAGTAAPASDAPATTIAASQATDAAPATTGAATEPTDAPAPTLAPVPEGTKLRVADQLNALALPLELSGQAEDVPYEIEYSAFVGGPPMLEAFNAGAIDLGFVGDTPPVLAAARDQDIVIVGAWRGTGSTIAVVSPPGKGITSVADLKGKKFAYTKSTALQAYALAALREAGLTEADIEVVDLGVLDIVGAVKSGAVDAGVLVEPIMASYLAEEPEATVVRDGTGLASGLQFLITTSETLADPAKAAAIGDYIRRESIAFGWREQNIDVWNDGYAAANKIDVAIAASLSERNGAQLFVPLDADVIATEQDLADLFHEAGVIPERLDISKVFDNRFDFIIGGSPS